MTSYDSNFLSICYKAFNGKTKDEVLQMMDKLYRESSTTFQIAFLNGASDYFYNEEGIPYTKHYENFKSVKCGKDQYPDFLDFNRTSGSVILRYYKSANEYWKRYGIIFRTANKSGKVYDVKE